jgi:hypothetical protein
MGLEFVIMIAGGWNYLKLYMLLMLVKELAELESVSMWPTCPLFSGK